MGNSGHHQSSVKSLQRCKIEIELNFIVLAGEEKLGCDIVGKALRAPVRLIASNAGVEGDVIIEKLLGQPFEIGYNAVRPLDW